jgi:hypothetical protein
LGGGLGTLANVFTDNLRNRSRRSKTIDGDVMLIIWRTFIYSTFNNFYCWCVFIFENFCVPSIPRAIGNMWWFEYTLYLN